MSIFQFVVLDPRRTAEQLTPDQWDNTLGIEVTIPTLNLCGRGNIDGQHGVQGSHPRWVGRAAVEIAANLAASPDGDGQTSIPPAGTTIAFLRPDVDAIVAAALLVLRALAGGYSPDGVYGGGAAEDSRFYDVSVSGISGKPSPMLARIQQIARSDSFRPGGSWSPRPLPTVAAPWPRTGDVGPVDGTESLSPLGVICSPSSGQRQMQLANRVAVAACWLIGADAATAADIYDACGAAWSGRDSDDGPRDAADAWQWTVMSAAHVATKARLAMARAVESGEIKIRVALGNPPDGGSIYDGDGALITMAEYESNHSYTGQPAALAVVESAHIGAMGIGYCVAPVVVAVMPPVKGHHKATVGSWAPGLLDHVRLRAKLNAAERAARAKMSTDRPDILKALDDGDVWGGASTITGSPQGLGTWLSVEEIARIAAECMEDDEPDSTASIMKVAAGWP